jgi:hypothetical protein
LAGDWRAIHLWDGTMAGTQIAYAKLDYCGADRNGCIVGDGVQANLVTLDHLTIGHVGPDSNGILEYDTDSNFIITNSVFNDIAPGQICYLGPGALICRYRYQQHLQRGRHDRSGRRDNQNHDVLGRSGNQPSR